MQEITTSEEGDPITAPVVEATFETTAPTTATTNEDDPIATLPSGPEGEATSETVLMASDKNANVSTATLQEDTTLMTADVMNTGKDVQSAGVNAEAAATTETDAVDSMAAVTLANERVSFGSGPVGGLLAVATTNHTVPCGSAQTEQAGDDGRGAAADERGAVASDSARSRKRKLKHKRERKLDDASPAATRRRPGAAAYGEVVPRRPTSRTREIAA